MSLVLCSISLAVKRDLAKVQSRVRLPYIAPKYSRQALKVVEDNNWYPSTERSERELRCNTMGYKNNIVKSVDTSCG